MNNYRKKYLETLIQDEVGELSHLETEVVNSIARDKIISDNIEVELDKQLTFGERLSDRIAEFRRKLDLYHYFLPDTFCLDNDQCLAA